MPDPEGLVERYRQIVPSILGLVKDGKRILIVTHIDADGLCSGSIAFAALKRKGANVILRTVPDLDSRTVDTIEGEKFDYNIFTDLASTMTAELEDAFGSRFLVIDHHQISEDDVRKETVVNAWRYGYDGGKEACSSTMAYFFATSIDPANSDLSPLAVVGSLADRQEGGEGRSLTGLNRIVMEDAQNSGLLTVTKDLMFTGRETRPIHESIALTSTPYLKGLTGSKDAVLATLHQAGLPLKDGGTWRTISSLSNEEKMKLTEVIASSLGPEAGATQALAGLVGDVYSFEYEDSFTPLRDAREFGTLLNACGRMGATGVGISVCLGDRGESLKSAMKTLSDYRSGINKALEGLASDPARIETFGRMVAVRGEDIVDEKLLGPVISILTSSPGQKDKVLVGFAKSRDEELKVSSRVGDEFPGEVNLGLLMREAAELAGGVGGGHTMAAGAKIPAGSLESFRAAVAARIPA